MTARGSTSVSDVMNAWETLKDKCVCIRNRLYSSCAWTYWTDAEYKRRWNSSSWWRHALELKRKLGEEKTQARFHIRQKLNLCLQQAEQDMDWEAGRDPQRFVAAHGDDGTVFHSRSVTIEPFQFFMNDFKQPVCVDQIKFSSVGLCGYVYMFDSSCKPPGSYINQIVKSRKIWG